MRIDVGKVGGALAQQEPPKIGYGEPQKDQSNLLRGRAKNTNIGALIVIIVRIRFWGHNTTIIIRNAQK